MHSSGLLVRLENELTTLPDFYVILINALESFDDETDLAEILQYECIQEVGGYAPQPFVYTPSTALFNATTGYASAPNIIAEFSEALANDGIEHTHVALWQGRGATANKVISSVNTTNSRITCNGHGLTNGARAFIRSTGTLPTGAAIVRDYVKVIDANTIELYTNNTLTTQRTFTTVGTGTLRLQYASGALFEYESNVGSINPGSSKSFDFVYQVS